MHRAYTAEKYLDLVRRIRRARDGIAITTDIIVGFPGETEDDYKQTRDLVDKIQRAQSGFAPSCKRIESPKSRTAGRPMCGSALRRPQQNQSRPLNGANAHQQNCRI